MALSLSVIGGAAGNGSFVTQVQAGYAQYLITVLSESNATPDYVVRRKFAQTVEKALTSYAQATAVQLASLIQSQHPTTYTDLATIADTDVVAAITAAFTQLAYATILPS